MPKGAYFDSSLGYEHYRTVFDYPIGGKNRLHPTQKPIDFVKKCLKISVPCGGIVLDPYMGSGTSGVACQELGLDFIGVEINEAYFNIAQSRIESTDTR